MGRHGDATESSVIREKEKRQTERELNPRHRHRKIEQEEVTRLKNILPVLT